VRQILTDAACKTRSPSVGRFEIADLRQVGLVLRITANGARTFAFRFRHPTSRKTLRATIGTYPATSLEDARKRAKEMAAQVQAGSSPIEVRKAERENAPARTFQALAKRYLREHATRHKRPRSAEEDRRNLEKHILPKWGARDFRTIRRTDVIELIESIVHAGKHAAGNRVHSLISKIFSFAIDAALLDVHPAARLKKRGIERVGRRVLTDDEIRLFWHSAVLPPVTRSVGLALRLSLLTGARANEVAGATKSELQGLGTPEPAWLIPEERSKNKDAHLVPLSPLALAVIRSALELTAEDSEYLFPTRLKREQPIDAHALTTAMRRLCTALKGQRDPAARTWQHDPPSPHDLRRTITSRLAALGVPREIRERVLNHKTARRTTEGRHYNVYEFSSEKRSALNQWSDALSVALKQDTAGAVL
jgi:integrase